VCASANTRTQTARPALSARDINQVQRPCSNAGSHPADGWRAASFPTGEAVRGTGAGALHPDTAHSTNGGNQKAHAAPTAHFWLLALPEPLTVSPTPGAAVVLSPVPLVPVRAQVTNVSAVLGRN